MRKLSRRFLALALLASGISLFAGQKVSAASINGITVSPVLEQLSVSKGQNATSFNATITNNTSSTVDVNLSSQNFTNLDQRGGLDFDLKSPTAQKHTLANYVHFTLNQLVLTPSQTITDPIKLTNINQLSSGGHYAAVIYRVSSPTANKHNSVALSEAIATLVFISTKGGGTQQISLLPPVVSRLDTSFPTSLNMVLTNSGNTQSTVNGLVQVYNSKNKLISYGQLNTNSSLILPGSDRLFTVPLKNITKPSFWPSRYRVVIKYAYVGQNNQSIYTTSFYYISAANIITLLLLAILIGIVAYKVINSKKYKLPSPEKANSTKAADVTPTQSKKRSISVRTE